MFHKKKTLDEQIEEHEHELSTIYKTLKKISDRLTEIDKLIKERILRG